MIKNKKLLAYLGLFFVVFVWGASPLITYELQKIYSPTFKLAFGELILIIIYLLMSVKHFKEFNRGYFKIGLLTGLFLALANVTQKIGLLYTTPAKYAFLENLSCVVVPILTFFLIKKKIKLVTVLSSLICLGGVFVLNGISFDSGWGVGELLCAASGILYGFNIAITGAYAKKFYVPMYLAVQCIMGLSVSLVLSVILHKTGIEPIKFPVTPHLIAIIILVTAISSALCWTIRTNAMKHVSASAVAVIMPFSAVITTVASVIMGTDTLSSAIIVGGIMIVAAIILSSFDA